MNDFFFTTFLTENEHDFVKEEIRKFCEANNIELLYYRKFKRGHQPGWRESKVRGDIGKFKKFLKDISLTVNNRHRDLIQLNRQYKDGKITAEEYFAKL